jgi:hypothetical protein
MDEEVGGDSKLDELIIVVEGELELELTEDEGIAIELELVEVASVEEKLVLLTEELTVVDDDVASVLVDAVVAVVAVVVIGVPTTPM